MIEKLNDWGNISIKNKVNEIISQLNVQEENRKKILEEFDKMVGTKKGKTMDNELIDVKMMVDRGGAEEEITVDGYVDYSVDRKYGEDADGGRGECRVFVEDVYGVAAYDVDDNDFELTVNEMDVAKMLLGDKFLEDYV